MPVCLSGSSVSVLTIRTSVSSAMPHCASPPQHRVPLRLSTIIPPTKPLHIDPLLIIALDPQPGCRKPVPPFLPEELVHAFVILCRIAGRAGQSQGTKGQVK